MSGIFLGLGNPLLDISKDVDQAYLDKYEIKMNDAILAEDKHQPIFNELLKDGAQLIAGGATLNSVRVLQWMIQDKASTGFVGCLGKDEFGKIIKDSCDKDGVAGHWLEDETTPTGTCATCIFEKERSLVTNLAAANNYKKTHFDSDAIQKTLKDAQFVYNSGFFLTVSTDTIQAVGEHCAENNKVYCMNLSAPFIVQFFTDPLNAAIPNLDYMFGNESEAAAYGEKMGFEDKSPKGVALEISKMPKKNDKRKRTVVITQGADPTIVAYDGKITEYPVKPLAAEEIVDSNSAGDAFVGGFLAALIKGKEIEDCCNAGHYSSSVILKVSGCALSGSPELKL